MHIWLIKLVFQEIQGNKYGNQSSGYLRGEEGFVIGKKDIKVLLGVSSKSLFPTWWIVGVDGVDVKIFHEAMHLIHVAFCFLGFILQ